MPVSESCESSGRRFTPRPFAAVPFVLICLGLTETAAAESATASIAVNARFASRTSLKVSAEVLRFDVVDPAKPATVTVDFSAAARTLTGGEVVLLFEMLRAIEGPEGRPDVEAALTLAGEGEGAISRAVVAAPQVARRWMDSGLRTGRLIFALRARAVGTYTVPMDFTLSAP